MASSRSSGVVVVLSLLALGIALALVAQRYRVPGTVPRLRMMPLEEETGESAPDLPPGVTVPARLVARVAVVERVTGLAVPGSRVRAAAGTSLGYGLRNEDGSRVLEITSEVGPRGTVSVLVEADEQPAVPHSVRVFSSRRQDALDAPLQPLEVPSPPEGRGRLVLRILAGPEGPACVPVTLHWNHPDGRPCTGTVDLEREPAADGTLTVTGLRAGTWTVKTGLDGRSRRWWNDGLEVEVHGGETTNVDVPLPGPAGVLDLRLPPGAVATGGFLVLDHDPDRIRVSARRPVTLPPGRVRHRLRLSPGEYRAAVHLGGDEPLALTLDIVAGEVTGMDAAGD